MENYRRYFLKHLIRKTLDVKKLNKIIKDYNLQKKIVKLKKKEKINYFKSFFGINLNDEKKINKKIINYNSIQCQNKRRYMEDRIIIDRYGDFYIFGVLDGHGGDQCVEYVKNNFFKEFLINYYALKNRTIEYIIQFTIYQLHQIFLLKTIPDDYSGTTLCLILFYKKKYYIINLGDSKCIFISNNKVEYKTKDHSPSDLQEEKMIKSNGGFVENNRILGRWLNISRTIGDKHLADLTSRKCDIKSGNIKDIKKKTILLTTDGMYEGKEFPKKKLINIINNKKSLKTKCNAICKYCKTFSTDNLSILILRFKQ